MKKKHKLFSVISLALLFLCCIGTDAMAQVSRKRVQEVNDTIPFLNRFSLSSNVIDWALLIANAQLEFDLVGRDYNRWSILLSAKGRWDTNNDRKSYNVYNVSEYRIETRHYYRTSYLAQGDTLGFLQKLFSPRRQHPRTHRAYYIGGYASYGTYALKFSSLGKQGKFGSIGASFGWSIPLYNYNNCFLDLDLGGSLGFVMTRNDAFRFDEESNCYPVVPGQSSGWHLVPYPVPTNLHCSFVFRFQSVKDKYKKINYARRDKLSEHQRIKREKEAVKDSIRQANGESEPQKGIKGLAGKLNPFKKKAKSENTQVTDSATVKGKKEKPSKEKKEKKSKKKSKQEEQTIEPTPIESPSAETIEQAEALSEPEKKEE